MASDHGLCETPGCCGNEFRPCGCAASYNRIRYCPLHAAAPALLEALEQAYERFIRIGDLDYAEDVLAAIRAAKGESNG